MHRLNFNVDLEIINVILSCSIERMYKNITKIPNKFNFVKTLFKKKDAYTYREALKGYQLL